MTDMQAHAAVERLLTELDRATGMFDDEQRITAEEMLTYFATAEVDGAITPLDTDEFEAVTHEPTTETYDWDDPWPVTYGIDGSTTKSLQFDNGLIASASAAKLGVSGETENTHLADRTTTTLVAYLHDEAFSFGGRTADLDIPEGVDAHLFRFPPCERTNRLEEYIVGVSRTYAEGKHARELAAELDGPLFVDGPLYPSPTFEWMLFEQAGKGPRQMTDVWPEMVGDILQNYVGTIETMYANDLPIVGVVKTGGSSAVLSELESQIEAVEADVGLPLPWATDHQLFSEALFTKDDKYGDRGPLISYTPWLFREHQMVHGESVVPFETFDGVSLEFGDPQEYQRAFFYARPPMSDTVMRVEIPYMFARDPDLRERIQRKMLLELADQQKEPRAITHADKRARITRDERESFRNLITEAAPIVDRNEQRGYDDFGSA
jgi:hypothetical protein